MQLRGPSRLALVVVLGVLAAVLGLGGMSADGDVAAADSHSGHAGLVTQLVGGQAMTRPAQPVPPAQGGLFAVLPSARALAWALVTRAEPDPVRGESTAADQSTRRVRAPPVFAA